MKRDGAKGPAYKGLLVYVKSAIVRPDSIHSVPNDDTAYRSTEYMMYHPRFPHESTVDQFFDPYQWDAYYTLGRYMAGDLLGIELRKAGLLDPRLSALRKLDTAGIVRLLGGR